MFGSICRSRWVGGPGESSLYIPQLTPERKAAIIQISESPHLDPQINSVLYALPQGAKPTNNG